MPIQIIRPDEPMTIDNIVVVIFGEPGMRKTSLAYTSEDPFLFDYDNGSHRAVGRKTTARLMKWEETNEGLSQIEKGELGFKPKTLIIDTAGTMLDDYIAAYVKKQDFKNSKSGGELSLSGYGALKTVFNQFLSRVRSLKMDLVFVCHSEQFKDGDDVKHRPKMTGGSYDVLISKADLVGYMESKNNESTLDFNPTDRHIGKNTAEFDILQVPHYQDPSFSTLMSNIIRDTKEKIQSKSEEQEKAIELLATHRQTIDNMSKPDEAREVYQEVQKMSPIYRDQLVTLLERKYLGFWEEKFSKIEDDKGLTEMVQLLSKDDTLIPKFKHAVRRLFKERAKALECEYVSDSGEYKPIDLKTS